MKFVANVEVNHRIAASYSMPKRRSQRSSVALGTKPGNPNELILFLQSLQNSMGTMYKVKDNIVHVFEKFAKEGKMTIRFKEPPHDLIINSETGTLERFLRAIKMAIGKNICPKMMKLPVVNNVPLKKIPPKPKQHLTYLSKSEYPILEGFPKSAVSVKISGLQKTRFDMRLLGLQFLKVLDLSDNCLTVLPPELDLLLSLQELCLANNNLGEPLDSEKKTAWKWLRGERLSRQLKDLDLSGNKLSFLHPSVCQLTALRTLKLRNNNLRILPSAMGLLKNLKTLVASENQLMFFPGSIVFLRLWHLDVTCNNFSSESQGIVAVDLLQRVPSLMEWSARRVVNSRLNFGPCDLPVEVQHYLDTVSFCQCRKACFESGIFVYSRISTSTIAENTIRQMGDVTDLPVQLRLCSLQCATTFTTVNFNE